MTGAGLLELAAQTALGPTDPAQMTEAAVAALASGVDSPALRMLASLSKDELDQAPPLFAEAMNELEIPAPSPQAAVMLLSRISASNVATGRNTPYDGAKRIWMLCLRLPEGHAPVLDPFVYAASEWEDRPEDRALFNAAILREAHELLTASDMPQQKGQAH